MRALVSTRKGLFVMDAAKAGAWKIAKSHFDGVKTSYSVYDPVHKCVWAGLNHGHWGAKLHVSRDRGKTFTEVGAPKFPEPPPGMDAKGDTLIDFWALASDPSGRIWLGVEPAALFYSDDEGATWRLCEGLYRVPGRDKWFGAATDAHCLHSLLIDPRDANHILVGISVAGMLETRDRGATWQYINRGMKANFMPDPDVEIGQDPHMTVMAPSDPRVLWQQNHCGLFKSSDMGQSWQELSKARGVKSAFGWGIAVDEEDADVAYTVPAASDTNRTPVKKRLFVQRTKDGGKSWSVLSRGLPSGLCYDIVYRHCLALKDKALMFGSTTGNLYFSANRGESWKQFPAHLPPIYAVKLF